MTVVEPDRGPPVVTAAGQDKVQVSVLVQVANGDARKVDRECWSAMGLF